MQDDFNFVYPWINDAFATYTPLAKLGEGIQLQISELCVQLHHFNQNVVRQKKTRKIIRQAVPNYARKGFKSYQQQMETRDFC